MIASPDPISQRAGHARGEVARDRRDDERGQRQREEPEPRLERRVAEHVLEVEREIEERRRRSTLRSRMPRSARRRSRRRGTGGGRASGLRCDSSIARTRRAGRPLRRGSRGSAGSTSPSRSPAGGRRRAGTASRSEPPSRASRRARCRGSSTRPPASTVTTIAASSDRDVDEEDPAPAGPFGEDAAHERPDRNGGSRSWPPRSRTRCHARGRGRHSRAAPARPRT